MRWPSLEKCTAFTFPSEKPDRVIDWVLFPPDWYLVEGFVAESSLSDHLPVAAFVSRGLL